MRLLYSLVLLVGMTVGATLIWVMIPMNTGDSTFNFVMYLQFELFYNGWIQATIYNLFDIYFLPGLSKKTFLVLFVISNASSLTSIALCKIFRYEQDNPWTQILPGLVGPSSTFLLYLFYSLWIHHSKKPIPIGWYHNVIVLNSSDSLNEIEGEPIKHTYLADPIRRVLVGGLFCAIMTAMWLINQAARTYFTEISSTIGQFYFTICFHFLALVLRFFVPRIAGKMNCYDLQMISGFAMDVLFFLIFRSLFIEVQDITPFIYMTLIEIVLESVPFIIRATTHFYKLINYVKGCLRMSDNQSYENYRDQVAAQCFLKTIAQLYSIIIFLLFFNISKYSYNSIYWKPLLGLNQPSNATAESLEQKHVRLMTFYGIQFICAVLVGGLKIWVVFPKFFYVRPEEKGLIIFRRMDSLLITIGLMGHFVHDVVVFTMDTKPLLQS